MEGKRQKKRLAQFVFGTPQGGSENGPARQVQFGRVVIDVDTVAEMIGGIGENRVTRRRHEEVRAPSLRAVNDEFELFLRRQRRRGRRR